MTDTIETVQCRPLSLSIEGATYCRVQSVTLFEDRFYAALVSDNPGQPHQRAARILRASNDLSTFEEVFSRPLPSDYVQIDGQVRKLALEQGFRNFVIWSLPGTDELFLLISLISVKGSKILATTDGEEFQEMTNPSPAPAVAPLGRLLPIGTRLLGVPAAPWTPSSRPRTRTPQADVFYSDDPSTWHPACEPGFGDANNLGVSRLAVVDGHVFASTVNPVAGFDLWRAPIDGDADEFAWESVLTQGAFRYALNKAVLSMTALDDVLFLSTATLATGKLKVGDHGPEILAVRPDKTWDVIVGQPRFSPDGLKVPLSAYGPGFNDKSNATFTQLCNSGSRLVACQQRFEGDETGEDGDYAGVPTMWTSQDGMDWQELEVAGLPPLARIGASMTVEHGLVLGGEAKADTEGAAMAPLVLVNVPAT